MYAKNNYSFIPRALSFAECKVRTWLKPFKQLWMQIRAQGTYTVLQQQLGFIISYIHSEHPEDTFHMDLGFSDSYEGAKGRVTNKMHPSSIMLTSVH